MSVDVSPDGQTLVFDLSLGAHGQLQGLGPHWELWAMAGEGAAQKNYAMTPAEALRASTILAAESSACR